MKRRSCEAEYLEATIMVQYVHFPRLGLAALLGASLTLGTAHYVTAQGSTDAESVASAQPAIIYSGSPAVVFVENAAPPGGDEVSEIAGRSVLNNLPQPGDAFPTDPWASPD
ncbi:MAG TPA: hypothetical protein VII06_32965 [Chloroflexota bacterium]